MRWKLVAAVALLIVAVVGVTLAVSSALAGPTTEGPDYLTAEATIGDVAETVVATGVLERGTVYALAFGSAPTVVSTTGASTAGASEAWQVEDVAVTDGDLMTKDQILASADTTSLRRDLRSAEAQLRAARLERAVADQQRDDAPTTLTRRQARMAQESADSHIASAQASIADLRDRIARSTLVAPGDGVVIDVAIARRRERPGRRRHHRRDRADPGHGGIRRGRSRQPGARAARRGDRRCHRRDAGRHRGRHRARGERRTPAAPS